MNNLICGDILGGPIILIADGRTDDLEVTFSAVRSVSYYASMPAIMGTADGEPMHIFVVDDTRIIVRI